MLSSRFALPPPLASVPEYRGAIANTRVQIPTGSGWPRAGVAPHYRPRCHALRERYRIPHPLPRG